ncbi:FecCD family ABC transporter permease [Baia soyae]|uniref:Iron complex transport system permease protein n=1 Tax=Baia soyae TaxID=1544746 RepID=A0A4R2S192_9BACL|nr:iron ABC transporter permease [Baia soyae]TCP69244.1 iron complex transport system permease protein [Baia soyae]
MEGLSAQESKGTTHPLFRKRVIVLILLVLGLLGAVCYAVFAGPVSFTSTELIDGVLHQQDNMAKRIVWDLRLPRILIGLIVGICLALSGSILQGVMRNPLSDPGIIGVSSGAGVIATTMLIIFPTTAATFLPIGAFVGAFGTTLLIYFLSWNQGASSHRIILVGVAINALIGAILSSLMLLFSDRVQSVLPWLSGGIGGVGWSQFQMVVGYALIAIVLSFFAAHHLRVLSLGDEVAKLLGHRVERSRFFLILLSSLLAAIAVSVSGLIGFVGLVIPHILRMIIGNDARYLLPASALGGALLVTLADAFARTWFDPIELPVGVFLSILGGPFFLFILLKGMRKNATS